MGKKIGNILKTIAPLALGIAFPGIGSAIGGALGATGATASALGGGILGAGSSLLTGGGAKGALLGGLTGGLGGYAGGGGSLFGGGSGTLNGLNSAGLASQAASDAASGFGGKALGGILGGGGSSYSSALSPLASTALGSYSNDKATKELIAKQNEAKGLYDQFANESFTPGDLAGTPGYQFQLEQSQKALDRKNAAMGNYASGAALNEAGANAQGLANTTYNDAYNQFLATQAQKLGAVGAQAGILGTIGNAQATGTLNQGQLLSQGVAGVLGGSPYTLGNSDMQTQLDAYKKRYGAL